MDLIDREQLMNYIRSRKINIGKLAHDVIMKQPNIQPQEPNEDCISREQALEPYKILEDTDTLSVYTIRQNLAELPPVTPTRPAGHWIKMPKDAYDSSSTPHIYCSKCKAEPFGDIFHNYCPNCGAKMVEPQESEE